MPRGANGTFTLAIGAFSPGGLIKSSDDNTLFNDFALGFTQSLATTGVSTMTGPINASAGLVTTPGYTFSGASKTGFYLAGANQIGIATNGVQAATVNSDQSITFAGTIAAAKGTIPIGAVMDYAGGAASIPLPPGWLLCFGQFVSTTTYAALFAVLGNLYGSGAGTFGIPDYRGRATFGQDNMGGSAANRITIAGGNFDGTILGNTGGLQNQTLTLGQLPTGITSAANNSITLFPNGNSGTQFPISGGGWSGVLNNATGSGNNYPQVGNNVISSTNNVSATVSISVTSNNTSGSAHTIMNPAVIVNKIIYSGI